MGYSEPHGEPKDYFTLRKPQESDEVKRESILSALMRVEFIDLISHVAFYATLVLGLLTGVAVLFGWSPPWLQQWLIEYGWRFTELAFFVSIVCAALSTVQTQERLKQM